MVKLPEKVRSTLERTVNSLRMSENIYGVGLFGSWARDEAVSSSDVDLFVLDKDDFDYEYVQRTETKGVHIDLNHIPRKWIKSLIPPEVDQKLYEVRILYDRDWSLTNTKLSMSKAYSSPERILIRTEAHIIDCDIYLSRATSAFSREDYLSASLFAANAHERLLRVLLDAELEHFSLSHSIEQYHDSSYRLGIPDLFSDYLELTGFNKEHSESARNKLRLFEQIWEEIRATVMRNSRVLKSSHFKIRTKLDYYLNPAFLQGATARTSYMIDTGKAAEASHYLNNILLDIAEHYLWLKSSALKVKANYTTLLRSMEKLEHDNPQNYRNMTTILVPTQASKTDAATNIKKTRKNALKIRSMKRDLIQKRGSRSARPLQSPPQSSCKTY